VLPSGRRQHGDACIPAVLNLSIKKSYPILFSCFSILQLIYFSKLRGFIVFNDVPAKAVLKRIEGDFLCVNLRVCLHD
jgi:hypothetical protein